MAYGELSEALQVAKQIVSASRRHGVDDGLDFGLAMLFLHRIFLDRTESVSLDEIIYSADPTREIIRRVENEIGTRFVADHWHRDPRSARHFLEEVQHILLTRGDIYGEDLLQASFEEILQAKLRSKASRETDVPPVIAALMARLSVHRPTKTLVPYCGLGDC